VTQKLALNDTGYAFGLFEEAMREYITNQDTSSKYAEKCLERSLSQIKMRN
jgi:hypothetical protein